MYLTSLPESFRLKLFSYQICSGMDSGAGSYLRLIDLCITQQICSEKGTQYDYKVQTGRGDWTAPQSCGVAPSSRGTAPSPLPSEEGTT